MHWLVILSYMYSINPTPPLHKQFNKESNAKGNCRHPMQQNHCGIWRLDESLISKAIKNKEMVAS